MLLLAVVVSLAPLAERRAQTFAVDLPDDTALLGRDWFFQVLARDPSQSQGVALSNGLQMTIGQ